MPDTHGKSLDEVRRYHEQIIAQDRTAKRQQLLKAKREGMAKKTPENSTNKEESSTSKAAMAEEETAETETTGRLKVM